MNEDQHAQQLRKDILNQARDIGANAARAKYDDLDAHLRSVWSRDLSIHATPIILEAFNTAGRVYKRNIFWMGSAGQWNQEAIAAALVSFTQTWANLSASSSTALNVPGDLASASEHVRELRTILDQFYSPHDRTQAANDAAFEKVYATLASLTSLIGYHMTHVGQHGATVPTDQVGWGEIYQTHEEHEDVITVTPMQEYTTRSAITRLLHIAQSDISITDSYREVILCALVHVVMQYAPAWMYDAALQVVYIIVERHNEHDDDSGDDFKEELKRQLREVGITTYDE